MLLEGCGIKENPRLVKNQTGAFSGEMTMNETGKVAVGLNPRNTIMQGADGEVKPDPPIEIYPSKLHGYWMARWRGHDYAITDFPTNVPGRKVVEYIEQETGEKVKVVE